MNEDYAKQLIEKAKLISPTTYYTIKDDEGIIRPQAGLWPSSGYGKEDAESRAKKTKSTVVLIEITEVKY